MSDTGPHIRHGRQLLQIPRKLPAAAASSALHMQVLGAPGALRPGAAGSKCPIEARMPLSLLVSTAAGGIIVVTDEVGAHRAGDPRLRAGRGP